MKLKTITLTDHQVKKNSVRYNAKTDDAQSVCSSVYISKQFLGSGPYPTVITLTIEAEVS